MVDESFGTYLLEVNTGPVLKGDHEGDMRMIAGMTEMLFGTGMCSPAFTDFKCLFDRSCWVRSGRAGVWRGGGAGQMSDSLHIHPRHRTTTALRPWQPACHVH